MAILSVPNRLLERGIIKKLNAGLKILGHGDLTKKVTVRAHVFSKSALEKIQKAGGTAEVIEKPETPLPRRKLINWNPGRIW